MVDACTDSLSKRDTAAASVRESISTHSRALLRHKQPRPTCEIKRPVLEGAVVAGGHEDGVVDADKRAHSVAVPVESADALAIHNVP